VESDDSQSQSSTSTAPTESQPSTGAPIKSFRDLIFAVSGTMPASTIKTSDTERNTTSSGKRKLDDSDVDANADDKSHGADNKTDLSGIVSESDVGITEFISEHDGFSGVLKQR